MSRVPRLALALVLVATAALGQPGYRPAPENLEARRWFQDAKFGLFIHWGIYSLLGDGEWVMNNRRIQVADYEKLAAFFNPIRYDADAWVRLAKEAGMKYITITSKHHDGFAMFDSKATDWDIVDRTPYGKDVLKPLAEACRRHGLKLFFYYSQLDWHHPDYFPRGRTGRDNGRPERGDWPRYLDFMDAQLTELLTNYGEIGGIWFDGWWDKPEADWRLDRTYALIHRLQPAALIGSNHHRRPFPGEDFQMFEKDLPGENRAGFSGEAEIGDLPLETCDTINTSWGFNLTDRRYKSVRELVQYLVRAAGYDANFLLNVGPMPDGTIQPEFVERLRGVGAWLRTHGRAIYGTRGGPVPPRPWGVTTRRGSTVYVHVLDWPDEALLVPLAGVRAARLVRDGAPVRFQRVDGGVVFELPRDRRDPYATVVEVETDGTR
ncbi:MAG TPA: alpha-L-fucosidase [Vicinamibacterales bacterium]|nr:alpha-L-fucosidase [Vicinamibacterales bacterium]